MYTHNKLAVRITQPYNNTTKLTQCCVLRRVVCADARKQIMTRLHFNTLQLKTTISKSGKISISL